MRGSVLVPSLAAYLVILGAMAVGATVQGSVGFGQNLIVVPVVAIVAPDALPGALLLAGLPITVFMAVREHRGIDRPGLLWLTVGRVPGTVVGAIVVAVVSTSLLGGIAGAAVLVGVAISLVAPPVPVTPVTATVAGAAAGTMGTAAAIEGPPMALLYQHHPGTTFRPTLAASFCIGTVMSLTALLIAHELYGWQLVLALGLVPGVLVGLVASGPLTRRLHGRSLRPFVLTIAAATGTVAVLRALL